MWYMGVFQNVGSFSPPHRLSQQFAGDPPRFGENGAEDRGNSLGVEWPGVHALCVQQNVFFAVLIAHGQASLFLELSELNGHLCAPVQQADKLAVKFIDSPSVIIERHFDSPWLSGSPGASAAFFEQKKTANPVLGSAATFSELLRWSYIFSSLAPARFTAAATP
jgi:hypothetical protein